MKIKNVSWRKAMTKAILFCSAMLVVLACDKSSEPMGKGEAEFLITDAPSDDASIKGVFVTVADLKVDGQSVSGFTKQTIDLKAYQEGNTKLLGTATFDAKAYKSVTLVLDTDTDASGSAPGCYVLAMDDSKYKLRNNGTIDVTINREWNVVANSKSSMVMDFDLRKSIVAMADPGVRYNFASNDNLNAAVRLMRLENTGAISGNYSEATAITADKIIVYAYKKGTFNAATETEGQGGEGIFFKNAVTSTEVKGTVSKTFKLAYLEEDDYELYFAAYTKDAATDRFNFQTLLKAQTTANGEAGGFIVVQSGITIAINSSIIGTL